MAFTDYNKFKGIKPTSQNDSGSTVDKAQPVLLVGGDDSTTGTGDVVLDWENISSESDIAVYDQNDNLLPYEIEFFDSTNESAVLWTYSSWTRDDTRQAKIVYGDGPASSEENVSGTWDNTGQLSEMVHHEEDLNDSSSNNRDLTNNGATAITDAQFDGGYSFDDVDDTQSFPSDFGIFDGSTDFTISYWVNQDDFNDQDFHGAVRAENTLQWGAGLDGTGSTSEFAVRINNTSTYTNPVSTTNLTTSEWNYIVISYDSSNGFKLFLNGVQQDSSGTTNIASDSFSNDNFIGDNGAGNNLLGGDIDEFKIFSDSKTVEEAQAEYDASPKAGQVFFSQEAAQATVQTVEETFDQTVSVKDEDRTKGFSQTLILENRNIPEQFNQDVAIKQTDQTRTLDSDVAIQDKDTEQNFTQDVTIKDFDAERTTSQDVSLKLNDQEESFSQDVILSAGNIEAFTNTVTVKKLDREKQASQDLIIENANVPEQFTQTTVVKDRDREKSASQTVTVARLDEEKTLESDVAVSDRGTKTLENTLVIALQPAPDVTNPLTVNVQTPTRTYVKNLNPTITKVKIKDIDL